ncbi:Aste57867_15052 [Aphanomyces stellatus]|uniref:Aste57867_15052 protein n=1 Tax=Aphanomyces stellatus TaxID=120398 RepID=A0A485L290_9STRA|nr:hypothetical protein As57867_014996 [Aphanomyces stellatus]VFT91866.1 Aste57867_15052 [Aphanomyces stellatus]
MRVFSALIAASALLALQTQAASQCRFSLNVANIASPTPAPAAVDGTTAPPTLVPNGTKKNETNPSVTAPNATTAPNGTNGSGENVTHVVPGTTPNNGGTTTTTTVVPGTVTTTTTAPNGKPETPATTEPKTTETKTTTTAAPNNTPPTTTAKADGPVTPAPVVTTTTTAPRRFLKDDPKTTTTTVAPGTTAPGGGGTATTTAGPLTTTVAPPGVTNATKGGNNTATKNATATDKSSSTSGAAMTYDMIACDESFYGMWATKGITCGGKAMDVSKVLNKGCQVYRGGLSIASVSSASLPACFSTCYIPACIKNSWDYEDTLGLSSDVYKTVNFGDWVPTASSLPTVLSSVPASSFSFSYACEVYSMCQCPAANVVSGGANSTDPSGSGLSSKGSSGSIVNDVWPDGTKKTNLDYVGQVTSSVSASITYTAIATTTTLAIASSVGVVSSSASAAAAGISTAGSTSMAGATLDIAQFAVCTGALSLPGGSKTLQLIGSQMSFSTFNWFSFGNDDTATTKPGKVTSHGRLLVEDYTGPRDKESGGMFSYTSRIGIKPSMLMYVTLAGVGSVIAGVGFILVVAILVGNCLSCVKDKEAYRKDCCDRAVGGLVLVAVISQYALGMVCMFQVCLTLKNPRGSKVTAELFVALATLLFLAMGIIFYGMWVVKRNQREIEDLGTAAHFDKSVHKRFGTLYDQYTFDNRFFFVAKMSLALLSGMVTGSFMITGKTQLIMLIAMHVAFFLLLEVRKPHSAKFVQNTSVMIVVIKVVVFGLSFFLITAATDGLPTNIQNIVSYVILALQLIVLICLLARQIYIFWKTRQLKNQKDDGAADEQTPPHLQMHAFDSIPGSMKHQQREWTSEYYNDQNRQAPQQQQQQQRPKDQSLQRIGQQPTNGHVNGKRFDDRHDPNEYAI